MRPESASVAFRQRTWSSPIGYTPKRKDALGAWEASNKEEVDMKKLVINLAALGCALLIGSTAWADGPVKTVVKGAADVTDATVGASVDAAGTAVGAAAGTAAVGAGAAVGAAAVATDAAVDTAITGARIPGAAVGAVVGSGEAMRDDVSSGPSGDDVSSDPSE
jgi:hypothetical protein